LKLKADQKFVWGEAQQKALDEIKQYLTSPPVLVPPQKHKPFKLYLSADERAIGSTLIQEFHLSRDTWTAKLKSIKATPSISNYNSFKFFNPKFDHSSYSKNLRKHSQI